MAQTAPAPDMRTRVETAPDMRTRVETAPDMRTRVETVHGALTLHRVLDPDLTALLAELSRVSGSRNPRKFPGSNPCSLERADFPKLRAQPYFLTEKTNGVRFLLFCCEHAGRRVCALVDRAMAVYLLPLQKMTTAMFQGSVVDCELAFNKVASAWQLLAFDAYVVSGIPVFHQRFSVRMAALKRAMSVYEPAPADPVAVLSKQFLPAYMVRAFKEHAQAARSFYDVDGVILVPEHSPAAIGRHTELFKLKTEHTVDFLVGAGGVELSVFSPSSGSHVHVASLREAAAPGSIVECARGEDGQWAVVCVRHDKTTANDVLTYERTLVNMQERVTLEDLAPLFDGTT